MDAIRTQLLLLETEGHDAGWDGPLAGPRLFEMCHHPDRPAVATRWAGPLQAALEQCCDALDGDVGAALLRIADVGEIASKFRRGGDYSRGAHVLHDLYQPPQGMPDAQFHGWGLRSESWMLRSGAADFDETSYAHKIHEHAERVEARTVWYVGRDGWLWMVNRIRGAEPQVVAIAPESTKISASGNLVHALARLTQAVASNPVPQRERDVPPPFWRAQQRGATS
jgi:hypothetical protein